MAAWTSWRTEACSVTTPTFTPTVRHTHERARGPRDLRALRPPGGGDHQVLRERRGPQLGPVDRDADADGAPDDAAALADRNPLDAPHAARRPGAQGGAGEVQGRQGAPAARDA